MSEHKHECECGCGCDGEEEVTLVTLTLDDDTELECEVIAIFPVQDKDYVALSPTSDTEEEQLFLFRFHQLEDGEAEILNIEDDAEYELVADAYDELVDEADWNDLMEEDE